MSRSSVTIGYKYFLGFHMGLASGPVDSINEIKIDDKTVWEGTQRDGTISINKPELFGEFEGGFEGDIVIASGRKSQRPNEYLQRQLPKIGGRIPAFRGITSAIFRRPYIGNRPFLRPLSFLAQRIFSTSDETEQWNTSRAAIREDGVTGFDGASTILAAPPGPQAGGFGTTRGGFTVEDPRRGRVFFLYWQRTLQQPVSFGNSQQHYLYDVDLGGFGSNFTENSVFTQGPNRGFGQGVALVDRQGYLVLQTPDFITRIDTETMKEQVRVGPIVGKISDAPSSSSLIEVEFAGVSYAYGGTLEDVNDFNSNRTAINIYNLSLSAAEDPFQFQGPTAPTIPGVPEAPIPSPPNATGAALNLVQRILSPFGSTYSRMKVVRSFNGGFWGVYYNPNQPEVGLARFKEVQTPAAPGEPLGVTRTIGLDFTTTKTFTDPVPTNDSGFYEVFGLDGVLTVEIFPENQRPEFHQKLQVKPLGTNIRYLESFSLYRERNLDGTVFQGPVIGINQFGFIDQAGNNDRNLVYSLFQNGRSLRVSRYSVTPRTRNADMNPAHIIREVLTNRQWGRGLPSSLIDDLSFSEAAQTLFNEKFGLSFFWAKETPLEEFLSMVLSHIDANLYTDRQTGKFVLKLVRPDYGDGSNLPVLDDSNVSKWVEVVQPSYEDLSNTVNVIFADRTNDLEGSINVQNLALVQIQGKEVTVTRQYPGITNRALATRVAARDLRSVSTPLLNGSIEVFPSVAETLYPGDPFVITSSRHGLRDVICRVRSIDYGSKKKKTVRVTFVQDTFGSTFSGILSDESGEPASLVAQPTPSPKELGLEAPYWFMENSLGSVEAERRLEDNPFAGYVFAGAARPEGAAVFGRVSISEGSLPRFVDNVIMSPWVQVDRDLTDNPADRFIQFEVGRDVVDVEPNTLAFLNDEIVLVEDITESTVVITRGVLDTVPQNHPEGSILVFAQIGGEFIDQEFSTSDERTVFVAPTSSVGTVPLSQVTPQEIVFDSRANSPFPPGNVRIDGRILREELEDNGPLTGESTITWSNRNRQTQVTANFLPWTAGSITPEPGTDNIVMIEPRLISGVYQTPYVFNLGQSTTLPAEDIPFKVFRYDVARVTLFSERDGFSSYQAKSGEVLIEGREFPYSLRLAFDDDDLVGSRRSFAKTIALA